MIPADGEARPTPPELEIPEVSDDPSAADASSLLIAAASVSDRFVGGYAVATAPAFRGRGYGEALSWAATMFRPDAGYLQASWMGRPVYERMGYETVATFQCWSAERRGRGSPA